ncbi:MAG: hypothetical protein A2648_01335 [Candidatus Lloydbacteria bacterium RIFCSPHIGHO2_01_FULL_41_20]|uniref:Uncharacterized protein n=1 Tax=Candidatus Lloydbacteria bacterium RIFCSPHIGHO2_01_FULL_41_20 TaxID=1798657 RepID=A0A1G2CSJ8_9BACT|nr:MAG: hypothetical protein A2648_01335 [Candidatus Lloydbacteria bacterium RIFCSPHIGHO2_01_FULL_41_20]
MNRFKTISSISIGAIVAVFVVSVLVIGGEFYAPLKDWLKATFTHHWLGKSAISVMSFILFSLIARIFLKNESEDMAEKLLMALFKIAILGTLVLSVLFFYLFSIH